MAVAPQSDLFELESAIRAIHGVLECAILTKGDEGESGPASIQVFTGPDADHAALLESINVEIRKRQVGDRLPDVQMFALDAQPRPGEWERLERLAEEAAREGAGMEEEAAGIETAGRPLAQTRQGEGAPPRAPLLRVDFSARGGTSEAEVALGGLDQEVIGHAHGTRTSHGLMVLAEATLQAASKLAGQQGIALVGATLVRAVGKDAVLILVEDAGEELLGAALVGERPEAEAVVRATLDAINRRLTRQVRQSPEDPG